MSHTTLVGQGQYHIASDYLILLTDIGFEQGITAADLLANTGLSESILFQPGVLVGHLSAIRFVDNFCQRCNNLTMAMEYGKRMTLSKHGALGFAAQYSATMTEAALKVMRYVETRAQLFRLERRHSDSHAQLLIHPRFDTNSPAGPFLSLAFLSSVETICRTLVGQQGRHAQSVIHIQATLANLSEQTVLPHCHIIDSASDNSLSWPLTALAHSLPFFDPNMAHLAEQQLENSLRELQQQRTMTEHVTVLLEQHLTHALTLEDVAQRLCTSSATLNRKLKQEHTTFQQLKDQVRFQQAKQLLQQGRLSQEQIADALGYSDASNFAKAFKSWAGCSPAQYRQQHKP
ncbi:MAG: helix-turn-helix domain-containing protein [Bacterioplanes sp.]|nr:helix-turn-helix domain-containing protein [Bacterioplanes sp.]